MLLFLLFLHFHLFFFLPCTSLLPFSGRQCKMTTKGWRIVKLQHNQLIEAMMAHWCTYTVHYGLYFFCPWILQYLDFFDKYQRQRSDFVSVQFLLLTFVHTESPFMHDTTQLRTGLIGICCECVGLYLELNHYFLNPQFHEMLELEANWLHLKAPYSSKIDIFHPRFNKYIYGINTIIKCGIWQPAKFQLISWFWTG